MSHDSGISTPPIRRAVLAKTIVSTADRMVARLGAPKARRQALQDARANPGAREFWTEVASYIERSFVL